MRSTFTVLFVGLLGCGGASVDRPTMLRELHAAMEEPVSTPGARASHNDLVTKIANEGVLEGMTRAEVAAVIGRGADCSSRPLCMQREYDADDWVYEVGVEPQTGFGHVPTLIVGFDSGGQVSRTTYITR